MKVQIQELLEKVQSTADFGSVPFHSINDTNALGDNALHCICAWGDLEAAKLLVESGINLHQKGEFGFTPLRVASDFGHSAIVAYLLAAGADPSTLDAPKVFDHEANARHMNSLGEQIKGLEDQVAHCAAGALGSAA
ncbi:ankyrin repeat domain-containing protein [Rhodanobacter hydrolyticus]|uniref:Ankyrin repeat domain-containing protein n=1 Tax=Rhodanobacter hydrolyticus TaxID=2250595 RepID=A0ABW8J9D9_9GAMM